MAYQRLGLLVQLNVEANELLANTFQGNHGAVRPYFASLIEGTEVHLVAPKESITASYKKVIRHQATYADTLRKHLQLRTGWDNYLYTGLRLKK